MTVYDKSNAKEYKEHGSHGAYICKMCRRNDVDLDGSVSCKGYNLICTTCMYKIKDILGINNVLELLQNEGARMQAEQEGR